jgi:hypothetical protein
MTKPNEQPTGFGTVSRDCREGERMMFIKDGNEIGYVEVVHVPNNAKIRLCFCMDRAIKLRRQDP